MGLINISRVSGGSSSVPTPPSGVDTLFNDGGAWYFKNSSGIVSTVAIDVTTVIGPTGPQGDQGIQGIQGIQGPTGSQGVQGDIGITGATGPQGDQGIQGIQGIQGLIGATGPQGDQGIQGVQGPTGPTGSQGIEGPIGPTGSGITSTGPTTIDHIWSGSQAQYDALGSWDTDTIYFVV
jgi:hypothetical protein